MLVDVPEIRPGRVWLKLENLQRTGSFKARGAFLRTLALERDGVTGLVTASAGNHGQGIALAAAELGLRACIVVPERASPAKTRAIERLGAELHHAGATFEAASECAREIAKQRGYEYVPAFDDDVVITGQGTVALELLHDAGPLDAIFVPVGGGGLLAGVAMARAELDQTGTEIVGVQAEACRAMALSFQHKRVVEQRGTTIADGIAIGAPTTRTLAATLRSAAGFYTVSEKQIRAAVRRLALDHKVVAEGAGAVAFAALVANASRFRGRDVGVIVSGGNIDAPRLLAILGGAE